MKWQTGVLLGGAAIIAIILAILFNLPGGEIGQEEGLIVTRGPNWNKVCYNQTCTIVLHHETINYFNGSNFNPINQTFINSTNPNYDYMIESGTYQVYFKENPVEENAVKFKFEKDTFERRIVFWLEPHALIWRNEEELELINFAQNVTGHPTNSYWLEPVYEEGSHEPIDHIIHNDTDTFIYPDIFGYGTNLTFEYDNSRLNKRLYVIPENLPEPTISKKDLTLDLVFKVDLPDKAEVWIKNNLWNGSTIKTNERISLKVKNQVLAYFKTPYGKEARHWEYDNETNTNESIQRRLKLDYEFEVRNQELYVIIKTPAKYLANADYNI
jgi:hypothetical protein